MDMMEYGTEQNYLQLFQGGRDMLDNVRLSQDVPEQQEHVKQGELYKMEDIYDSDGLLKTKGTCQTRKECCSRVKKLHANWGEGCG